MHSEGDNRFGLLHVEHEKKTQQPGVPTNVFGNYHGQGFPGSLSHLKAPFLAPHADVLVTARRQMKKYKLVLAVS